MLITSKDRSAQELARVCPLNLATTSLRLSSKKRKMKSFQSTGVVRCVFYTFLLCVYVTNCSALKNLTIGLFVPWTGSWPAGQRLASAAPIAIDKINSDPTILPDYHIGFEWKDCGCNKVMSAGGTVEFIKKSYSAIIGPYCSDGCTPSGLIAGFYKVPMITYSCSTPDLSVKKDYPTTARTFAYARTDEGILIKNTLELMKIFGWKRFTVITEIADPWSTIAKSFLKQKSLHGDAIDEINDVQYNPEQIAGPNEKEFTEELEAASRRSRKAILDQAKAKGRSMHIFSLMVITAYAFIFYYIN